MSFGRLSITKPEPPFILAIPNGLRPGCQVIVDGHVPDYWTDRFDVNLVTGHTPTQDWVSGADIALHVNPRFDEGETVLNTRIGGSWGTEHRETETINKGFDYQIVIACHDEYYTVSVNGRYLANFPHRIPLQAVGVVWIDGRVQVHKVDVVSPGN